jgi:steroid 5-alpha reductase family enzyme
MARNELIFVLGLVVGTALMLVTDLPFLVGLAASVGVFTLLWLVSLPLRNASIVDIFWGPGFVVLAWLYLAMSEGESTVRGLVTCALVTVWGVRLAGHIALRNVGHGEDFRYRAWREQAGKSFWWVSYVKVFLLQAVTLWVVSAPVLLAQLDRPESTLKVLDGLGILLWLVGFGLEAVADWQLLRFKRDPANRGRVMRSGLWSLSRHPNYFGEALLWWGIGVIAFSSGGALALFGPLLLTFLLLKISGVAMLDKALVERRPGYADYVRDVPAFVPSLFGRRIRPDRLAEGA